MLALVSDEMMGKVNKVLRVIASAVASLGIVLGMVVVAPVANAQPAHAATTSSCYYTYILTGTYPGTRVYSCYYDYNWWEETFLGKRDGRYYNRVPVYT